MINQLELRHFEYFLTLASTLHFGKAADKLYITQSALSQQIRKLESIVGVSLFVRDSRNVVLSQAGLEFQVEVEIIMNQISRGLENWKSRLDGGGGILRISYVASAMQSYLPSLLKTLNHQHPNIKLYLNDHSNQDQLKELETLQIDMGFLRSKPTSDILDYRSVYKENLTLVLPQDHAINEQNFENIGQLADETYILFPNQKSQMFYNQILELCLDQGFTPKTSHQTIHGPTIFKLVEIGLGISIIPTSLVDRKNYKVQYIELTDIKQKTELFAVWNKNNQNPSFSYLQKTLDEIL